MKNGDRPIQYVETDSFANQGLTKREYFAGLAMQGILSSPESIRILVEKGTKQQQLDNLSIVCIGFADELLKQLEQ